MINWKNHRAALTGAHKVLIKGVKWVIHSATSASASTPDCYVPFVGKIIENVGFNGAINDQPTGLIGLINGSPTARIGLLYDHKAFNGNINPNNIGFNSKVTDSKAFEGEICGS
jgi:hypothetical protein